MPCRVPVVERTVAGVFRYELYDEAGEALGGMTSEQEAWEVGDLVPCGGHMFEVLLVIEDELHVRRVI
jgi:hypothetical protein